MTDSDGQATRYTGPLMGLLVLVSAFLAAVLLIRGIGIDQQTGESRPARRRPLPAVVVDELLLRQARRAAAFDFARAAEALGALNDEVTLSEADRARLEARRAALGRYAELLDGVSAAIGRGEMSDVRLALPALEGWWAVPTAADRHAVTVALKPDTRRRAPKRDEKVATVQAVRWSALGASSCWRLISVAARASGTADAWITLAELFDELGRKDEAERALVQAWQHAGQRPAIAAALARVRRDPAGARYQLLHGQLYDAEAIAAIEAGKVRWRDRWVDVAARRKLAEGKVERDGTWVALTDAERAAAGWVRDAGRWTPTEQLDAKRRKWATAWGRQTGRVRVRTDQSKRLMERIAQVLDGSVPRLRRILGPLAPGSVPAAAAFDDAFNARLHYEALEVRDWGADGGVAVEAREVGDLVLGRDEASTARALVGQMARLHLRQRPAWLDRGAIVFFGGALDDGGWALELLRWDTAPPTLVDVVGGAPTASRPLARARHMAYAGALVYCLAEQHRALLRAAAKNGVPDARLLALEDDWKMAIARLVR